MLAKLKKLKNRRTKKTLCIEAKVERAAKFTELHTLLTIWQLSALKVKQYLRNTTL